MIEDDRAVVFEVVAGADGFQKPPGSRPWLCPKRLMAAAMGRAGCGLNRPCGPCPLSRRLKEQSGHPNAPVPIVPI